MKAVICSINSKYIHSSLAPWCLFAGVKAYCEDGITAKVVEGTINEQPDRIVERIMNEQPDVVGLCTYIWNIKTVNYVINKLKTILPDVIIVLGGPEVSYNAYELLSENKNIDFINSGEGEKQFALMLNAIKNKTQFDSIDGLCFHKGDEIIASPPCTPKEEPVSPYCEEYFNSLNNRIVYLETSRGCPYNCAFCLSGRCGDVRFFDIKTAKQNILLLANSGTKTVKFVDRTFNANKKRAKEIISFIIDNYGKEIPTDVCFHFEIAGDILDKETIDLLKSAPKGSIQLEIGLQSFNEITLKYINRKTNTDILRKNIASLIEKRNIHIHIDLIAGLPFEDINSFRNSFNIAFSLKPDMLQLGFLKLLYGAPMREESERYPCVYSPEPPYEVISTQWLDENELDKLHGVEDAVEKVYNSHRFSRSLDYVMSVCGLSAYDLFYLLSEKVGSVQNIRLDDYTETLYSFFSSLENVDKNKLRDYMVCDRLATNSSATLPECLRVSDPMLKKYRNAVNELFGKNENGKRGIAALYTEKCIVYSDYINKDKVTGEFELKYVSFDTLEKIIKNF